MRNRTDRYAELEALLLAEHPWSNPEVTAVPVTAGSGACLRRVDATVGSGETD
ncbi:hypothetical protein ACIP88_08170 [Streptomyces uncialis]|uniref:hypothetical protein n=1 Tax=Streptomyces uncialis TaxID=1048205 RepID=UPI0038270CB1